MRRTEAELWTLRDCKEDEGLSMLIDPEGLSHDNKVDALMSRFDFCGCGFPEPTLELIGKGLRHIADGCKLRPPQEGWLEESRAWFKAAHDLFGSEAGAYFFWYWATSEQLLEHGGSVPGWLTEHGKLILADIEGLDQ